MTAEAVAMLNAEVLMERFGRHIAVVILNRPRVMQRGTDHATPDNANTTTEGPTSRTEIFATPLSAD